MTIFNSYASLPEGKYCIPIITQFMDKYWALVKSLWSLVSLDSILIFTIIPLVHINLPLISQILQWILYYPYIITIIIIIPLIHINLLSNKCEISIFLLGPCAPHDQPSCAFSGLGDFSGSNNREMRRWKLRFKGRSWCQKSESAWYN